MDNLNTENVNGTSNGSSQPEAAAPSRDGYREAFNTISGVLDALPRSERGRVLRTLNELYAEDMKKRKVRQE